MASLLKFIPKTKAVTLKQLTWGVGFCRICNRECRYLRKHWRNDHAAVMQKKITTITKNLDLTTHPDKVFCAVGFCAICAKKHTKLRNHYTLFHYEGPDRQQLCEKLPQFSRKNILTIPFSGAISNVRKLTTSKGFCRICNDSFNNLRAHYLSLHDIRKFKDTRDHPTIKKLIPAEGEVDVDELSKGKGYCEICKEACENVLKHYRTYHKPRKQTTRKTIEKDSTEHPNVFCTKNGYCGECKKKFASLRKHYILIHLTKEQKKQYYEEEENRKRSQTMVGFTRRIPKEGPYDNLTFLTSKGFCEICNEQKKNLHDHFKRIHSKQVIPTAKPAYLDAIPIGGVTHPKKSLANCPGRCDICRQSVGYMLRHYLTHHSCTRPPPSLTEIPATGSIDASKLITGRGLCNRPECERSVACLRTHYLKGHDRKDGRKTANGKIKGIPRVGPVNFRHVTSGNGWCNKKYCKKYLNNLYDHYVACHVKGRKSVAMTITKEYGVRPAPFKCPHCGSVFSSFETAARHIGQRHPSLPYVDPVKLSRDEANEYFLRRDEESRALIAIGGKRQIIRRVGEKLRKLETMLKTPNTPVYLQAIKIKRAFLRLYEEPPRTIESLKTPFISYFDPGRMTPRMVFEIVKRSVGLPKFSATTFHRDPNIAQVHQPRIKDYAASSYQRGHLCAAGNHHDEEAVIQTYYYSNVVPMCQQANCGAYLEMERYIRKLADKFKKAYVLHFPIFKGPRETIGWGVQVPSSIGTVAIVKKGSGLYIIAWDVPNTTDGRELKNCVRNPFKLLKKAEIEVKFDKEDFIYWSTRSRTDE